MKRYALPLSVFPLVLLGGWIVPKASAQDQVQAGVYVDYFRLNQTKTNMVGLGGRLGWGSRHVHFEGEMSYDFEQAFTETFTSGTTVTVQRTNTRILHGLFGPKLSAGYGGLNLFATLKGGFINFRLDPRPVTAATFTSSVENLRATDVSGVLYPGAGLEGHVGPLGLRLDVGDAIYFNSGTHHNLRVAFGPYIRF